MGATSFHFHPPGEISRSGVLDVGLKCAHSCKFCYYSFMTEAGKSGQHDVLRHASFRPTADCLAIIDGLAAHGLINFDITGGEPTMHEGLPSMVRRARELGLGVRVITLGQFLLNKTGGHLLDELLAEGVTDFLFSLHAATEDGFREATRGSLKKVLAAMDALDAKGFQYTANTVIHAGNLTDLPHIARLSAARGVYHHNFIVFNAYYRWDTPESIAGLQAAYTDIAGPLTEAVNILTEAGRAVTIRYLPLCAAPHLARHMVGVVGVHHDPHEWMNRAGNPEREPAYCTEPLPVPIHGPRDIYALTRGPFTVDLGQAGSVQAVARRGEAFKIFPARCADCAAMDYCDGLDPKYVLLHGLKGIEPFARAEGVPPLLAERRAYLPAFALKRSPGADMLATVAQVLGRVPASTERTLSVIVAPGPQAARAATMAALARQNLPGPGCTEVLDCGFAAGSGEVSPAAALNAAVKTSSGMLLAFFMAGDIPASGMLARGVDFLAGRAELSVAVAGSADETAPDDFQTLLAGAETDGPLFLRRKAFDAAGGFQDGLTDCLFWDLRLAAAAAGHFGGRFVGGSGQAQTKGPRVDAGHKEFPKVVRRTPHIFPREIALAHAQAQAGRKEPL